MSDTTEDTKPKPQIELPANALVIVPVRGMVLFPGLVMPLTIGRAKSIAAAQEAARQGLPLGLLLQRRADAEDPGPGEFHPVGTAASVLRYLTAPDGKHHLVCQGQNRFRVIRFLDGYPFLVAEVEPLAEEDVRTPEIEVRRSLAMRRYA